MKRRLPILIILAAAVAAAAYFYPRFRKKPQAENEIVRSGNIEAHESLVSFKVPGGIIELPVEEGQSIAAGALLAHLEGADYRQSVRLDEAGVHGWKSNLAWTLAGTREQAATAADRHM